LRPAPVSTLFPYTTLFRSLRPPAPLPASDLVISECTYGARQHQSVAELERVLKEVVRRTVERGGKVLVPAFNLGRSQLVVHYLQDRKSTRLNSSHDQISYA